MTLDEFIEAFGNEFIETPLEMFNAETNYRQIEEWNSLTALSIISMVDDQMGKTITGADLRRFTSIKDLYNYIQSL